MGTPNRDEMARRALRFILRETANRPPTEQSGIFTIGGSLRRRGEAIDLLIDQCEQNEARWWRLSIEIDAALREELGAYEGKTFAELVSWWLSCEVVTKRDLAALLWCLMRDFTSLSSLWLARLVRCAEQMEGDGTMAMSLRVTCPIPAEGSPWVDRS